MISNYEKITKFERFITNLIINTKNYTDNETENY